MTNDKGEWTFTPPFDLAEGYWNISAQSPSNNLLSSDFDLTRVKSDLPDRFTEDFSSYNEAPITGPLLVQGGRIDFSGTNAEIAGGRNGKRYHLGDTSSKTGKFIFTPDYLTNEISFFQRSYVKYSTTSVKVSIYDETGKLIHDEVITSVEWSTFTYKSEQGVLISEIVVTVKHDVSGTDFYDITYKPVAPRHSSTHDSFMSYDDENSEKTLTHLNFNIENSSNKIHERIFTDTLKDVLSLDNKQLFINNDKQQDISQAQHGDIVQLKDLNINDTESWTQQTGTGTIAGVQYEVYSHNGSDAELLVQEGVKVELV
ncbi:hypothetical protein E05_21870 [Plautia stali symbiont]|nr:hypothetical protein E05_21870 [Plautia stali symbiont]